MRLALVWAVFAFLFATGPAPWSENRFRATQAREDGGLVSSVRAKAEAALSAGQPADASALLIGIVLGDASGLTRDTREQFRRASLTHVVAASGQNISLMLALVLPLLAWLGIGLRLRLALGVLLIGFYVPLAGGEAPIRRAAVMALVLIAARLRGHPTDGWHALGLAGIATLMLDRHSAASLGWQLSFAAVVGMLALGTRVSKLLAQRGVPGPLAEALGMTFSATAATSCLIAWRIGKLSLVAVPANLVAGPAVGPAMWLGMIASVVGQVSESAATVFAWLASLPAAAVLEVARVASGPSWASVNWQPSGLLALLSVGGVVLCGVIRRPGRSPA